MQGEQRAQGVAVGNGLIFGCVNGDLARCGDGGDLLDPDDGVFAGAGLFGPSLFGCGLFGRAVVGSGHSHFGRVFVGHEHQRRVRFGVEDGHLRLAATEGLLGHVGDRRLVAHSDFDELLHAKAAFGARREEHVLGLDPAHRARELVGQQLDDEGARHGRWCGGGGVEIGEDRGDGFGRVPVAVGRGVGRLHEASVERKRQRHDVGHVPVDQREVAVVARQAVIQRHSKRGHAIEQLAAVKRHIDAGNGDPRRLATGLGTVGEAGGEHIEGRAIANSRVLAPLDVVVDDLDEAAGLFGHGLHERTGVGVGHRRVVGPNHAHRKAAMPVFVPRDARVHGHAAHPDDLDDGLERQDLGDGRQRVVFADAVSAGDGAFDEHAGFAQLGDLGAGEHGHRNLRELGQVQHTLGVADGPAVDDERLGVVPNHAEQRVPESRARKRIGAIPDIAGGFRFAITLHAHARLLDALAGKHVRGDGGGEGGRGAENGNLHAISLHGNRDADVLGAADGGLATGLQGDRLAGEQGRDEGGFKRRDAGRIPASALVDDKRVGPSSGPHPMHDGAGQSGEASDGCAAVNRVEVAADLRPRRGIRDGGGGLGGEGLGGDRAAGVGGRKQVGDDHYRVLLGVGRGQVDASDGGPVTQQLTGRGEGRGSVGRRFLGDVAGQDERVAGLQGYIECEPALIGQERARGGVGEHDLAVQVLIGRNGEARQVHTAEQKARRHGRQRRARIARHLGLSGDDNAVRGVFDPVDAAADRDSVVRSRRPCGGGFDAVVEVNEAQQPTGQFVAAQRRHQRLEGEREHHRGGDPGVIGVAQRSVGAGLCGVDFDLGVDRVEQRNDRDGPAKEVVVVEAAHGVGRAVLHVAAALHVDVHGPGPGGRVGAWALGHGDGDGQRTVGLHHDAHRLAACCWSSPRERLDGLVAGFDPQRRAGFGRAEVAQDIGLVSGRAVYALCCEIRGDRAVESRRERCKPRVVGHLPGDTPGLNTFTVLDNDGAGQRGRRLRALAGGNGDRLVGLQRFEQGVVEAAEEVGNRLVFDDAGDGVGAGDDQDRVGVVAIVLRLPERVGLVPAADIRIDDRHEVDRFARHAADAGGEEVGIDRRRAHGCGVFKSRSDGFDERAWIGEGGVGDQRTQ